MKLHFKDFLLLHFLDSSDEKMPREPAVRMDSIRMELCKIKKLDNQYFLCNKR